MGQKKADWAEFKNLRKLYFDADMKMGAARSRITHICNGNEEVCDGRACINYKLDMLHLNGDIVPEQKMLPCSHFVESDNTNGCYRFHCPYAQGNHEYHECRKEADAFREEIRMFWEKKFANVK